jgi:hypothetical protein
LVEFNRERERLRQWAVDWEVPTDGIRPTEGKGISEIALARWHREGLVALVEFTSSDRREYLCLTVADVQAKMRESNTVHAWGSVVMTSDKPGQIIALSGDRQGDAICAVVATFSGSEAGGVISEGQILYHACPNPAPIGGRIGVFSPKYAPAVWDLTSEGSSAASTPANGAAESQGQHSRIHSYA